MPNFADASATLRESLNLTLPPVALAFAEEVPSGVALWDSTVPAGCRFWQEAAGRVFATNARQHDLCAVGAYTHNLESTPASERDLSDALKVFADLEYATPQDVAAIPVLSSKPKYVIYGPLDAIPLDPDVVLLFVRANQSLVLSEAVQQAEGGLAPAMGRPACAVVPQAFNSKRSALSLGCCGARAYLDILTDDTALFAIPASSLAAVTARVSKLAKANAVLTRFHEIRRDAVASGKTPSVRESLTALQDAAGA